MAGCNRMPWNERSGWSLAPVLAFLIAFGLRAYFLFTYRFPLLLHEQDGISYMAIAGDFLKLKPLTDTFRPPGYPAIVALFGLLPLDMELAARLASIAMDALVVFPLYGLARLALPRSAALTTVLLWGCFAFSLVFTPSPLSQSTYLFFLLAGTYYLLAPGTAPHRKVYLFAAGAWFAFSYLTRTEGIAGFVAAFMLLPILYIGAGWDRRVVARECAVFAGGFLLFSAPYWLFLHKHLGYWTISGKTEVAAKGVDSTLVLKGGAIVSEAGKGATLWLAQFGGVGGVIRNTIANSAGFIRVYWETFPLWAHLLAAVGLLSLLVIRERRMIVTFVVPVAATVPVYIAALPKAHSYIYPLFPLFFILLAAGGSRLADLVSRITANESRRKLIIWGILAMVLLSYGGRAFRDAVANYRSPGLVQQAMLASLIFREAGQKINAVSAQDDAVMTRWGLVAYYAGRRQIVLPNGSAAEVVAYGRKTGACYLTVDTMAVDRRRELENLLNPLMGKVADPALGIMPVATGVHYGVGGYVVYRLY